MIVNGQYKMVRCTRQEIFTAYNLVEILFIRVRAFTSLFFNILFYLSKWPLQKATLFKSWKILCLYRTHNINLYYRKIKS